MTGKNLIAILGLGKGSWGHIARLISEHKWNKIYLISNEWGRENFDSSKDVEWVLVDNQTSFDLLVKAVEERLPAEEEASVSLISGSGKEHIALLTALKNKGIKYDLIIITGEGTKNI